MAFLHVQTVNNYQFFWVWILLVFTKHYAKFGDRGERSIIFTDIHHSFIAFITKTPGIIFVLLTN